ncbi:NAD(P)-binding domain-containing protein [Pedobacter sp. NJ-S-72]
MIPLNNKISILGCGWYGLELAKELIKSGYKVKGSTTTPKKLNSLQQSGIIPYLINFSEGEDHFDTDFFNCDLLIISIPPKKEARLSNILSYQRSKKYQKQRSARIFQISFLSVLLLYTVIPIRKLMSLQYQIRRQNPEKQFYPPN